MKFIDKQAEYKAEAYTECMDEVVKELWAKGMDLALLVIVEMKKPFSSSSAFTSLQATVPQHSPAQSIKTIVLVGEEDGLVKDSS